MNDYPHIPSPDRLENLANAFAYDKFELSKEIRNWAKAIRILQKNSHLGDKERIILLTLEIEKLKKRWEEDKSFVNYM